MDLASAPFCPSLGHTLLLCQLCGVEETVSKWPAATRLVLVAPNWKHCLRFMYLFIFISKIYREKETE